MPRKKRITPEVRLDYSKMGSDLKFACWDLQYEMLIASKRMEIADLKLGKTQDYIDGFQLGWAYRESIMIGHGEIHDDIFGKY